MCLQQSCVYPAQSDSLALTLRTCLAWLGLHVCDSLSAGCFHTGIACTATGLRGVGVQHAPRRNSLDRRFLCTGILHNAFRKAYRQSPPFGAVFVVSCFLEW